MASQGCGHDSDTSSEDQFDQPDKSAPAPQEVARASGKCGCFGHLSYDTVDGGRVSLCDNHNIDAASFARDLLATERALIIDNNTWRGQGVHAAEQHPGHAAAGGLATVGPAPVADMGQANPESSSAERLRLEMPVNPAAVPSRAAYPNHPVTQHQQPMTLLELDRKVRQNAALSQNRLVRPDVAEPSVIPPRVQQPMIPPARAAVAGYNSGSPYHAQAMAQQVLPSTAGPNAAIPWHLQGMGMLEPSPISVARARYNSGFPYHPQVMAQQVLPETPGRKGGSSCGHKRKYPTTTAGRIQKKAEVKAKKDAKEKAVQDAHRAAEQLVAMKNDKAAQDASDRAVKLHDEENRLTEERHQAEKGSPSASLGKQKTVSPVPMHGEEDLIDPILRAYDLMMQSSKRV